MVRYWYGIVWYDMVSYGIGKVWSGIVRYGMVWYGHIQVCKIHLPLTCIWGPALAMAVMVSGPIAFTIFSNLSTSIAASCLALLISISSRIFSFLISASIDFVESASSES